MSAIYFDAYDSIELCDREKEMNEMAEYFREEYHSKKLHEYMPLDLNDIG